LYITKNINAPKAAPNNANPTLLSQLQIIPTIIPKAIHPAKIPHLAPSVVYYPINSPIKIIDAPKANMAGIINNINAKNLRPNIPQNIPISIAPTANKYLNFSNNADIKLKSFLQF